MVVFAKDSLINFYLKKHLKHFLHITVMIIISMHTILVKLEVIKVMLIFKNTVFRNSNSSYALSLEQSKKSRTFLRNVFKNITFILKEIVWLKCTHPQAI